MPDNAVSFFDAIDKPELKEELTPQSPWVYFTMELGLKGYSFEGGLGILAGDVFLQARKSQIPFVVVTLQYPIIWKPELKSYYQIEEFLKVDIKSLDLEQEGSVDIHANSDTIPLSIFTKRDETTCVVSLYEPGLRELYADMTTSEHRLFQEVALGFGGYKALKKLGYDPGILHMNEAATIFAVLAYLDDLCISGKTLDEALSEIKKKSLFTNHTLVPAAVASFTKDFYVRYVLVNIESEDVRKWLLTLLAENGNSLRRTSIAIELCGQLNGVSTMHATIASEEFKDNHNQKVTFHPVTNGIYLKRWTHPGFYKLFCDTHLLDNSDIPQKKYLDMVFSWTARELLHIKNQAKEELVNFLHTRVDQTGRMIDIPASARLAVWAKRFAGYKRPDMLFVNIPVLLDILRLENLYLIFSGNVHPGDDSQKQQLRSMLSAIEGNPELAKRVFYVQNYDLELATHLVKGADIWFNLPEIGKEACGTSWMKAIANLGILISTKDGGAGDIPDDSYYMVTGSSYEAEAISLYVKLDNACDLFKDEELWGDYVIHQLKSALPVASGARMMKDYLDLIFK